MDRINRINRNELISGLIKIGLELLILIATSVVSTPEQNKRLEKILQEIKDLPTG